MGWFLNFQIKSPSGIQLPVQIMITRKWVYCIGDRVNVSKARSQRKTHIADPSRFVESACACSLCVEEGKIK